MAHRDKQPLRMGLAVHAAELGNVGVHHQLLSRDHEIRVDDRGFDDLSTMHLTRRTEESLVEQERLYAIDERPRSVGVLLPEVVRPRRELGHGLVSPTVATSSEMVHDRVVALGEAAADLGIDVLLGVHAVATEPLGQLDHRRSAITEQWIELHDGLGHSATVPPEVNLYRRRTTASIRTQFS